jgi:hypothetical protein
VPVGDQAGDRERLGPAERHVELARHDQPDEPLPQSRRIRAERARAQRASA